MGRRKQAELMDEATRRSSMLAGVSDKVAIQLYDEGMAQLHRRGDDTFGSAVLLRDAVQWTEVINRMQHQLLYEVSRGDEADDKVISALMRRKQVAEASRRQVLASLMLVPVKPRGRPARSAQGAEDAEMEEDDGWDDFGKVSAAGDDGS